MNLTKIILEFDVKENSNFLKNLIAKYIEWDAYKNYGYK